MLILAYLFDIWGKIQLKTGLEAINKLAWYLKISVYDWTIGEERTDISEIRTRHEIILWEDSNWCQSASSQITVSSRNQQNRKTKFKLSQKNLMYLKWRNRQIIMTHPVVFLFSFGCLFTLFRVKSEQVESRIVVTDASVSDFMI